MGEYGKRVTGGGGIWGGGGDEGWRWSGASLVDYIDKDSEGLYNLHASIGKRNARPGAGFYGLGEEKVC